MGENTPREQESERMKAFRARKQKELRRRARVRQIEKAVLGVVVVGLTAGLIVLVVNLFRNGGPSTFEPVTESPEISTEAETETVLPKAPHSSTPVRALPTRSHARTPRTNAASQPRTWAAL